ncbi:glycolate oxidase iron-sulfur subunit [Campylobacterota bacterium]|nr:glycolate oxidase iron-sulfur subunit [Campylobacterota bacterium]
MKTVFDYAALANECVKCAKCIPNCTIHRVSRDETTSPRGFIHLLSCVQNGTLKLDKHAKKIFESCFLCTHCVSVCPSQVPTDLMIEQARAEIKTQLGLAFYKRAIFFILKRRGLTNLLARLGFVFKVCGFSEEKNGMRARFSMPMIKKDRLLPSLKSRSFLETYPERIDFDGERQVAIFIGCFANYIYTGVGDSLLYILKHLKINAFIPKDQLCCGAPSYFTGDLQTTKWLIKYNIEYFELFIGTVEAVLVPEATCSSMIIHDWLRVLEGEPEWQERARKIIAKVVIASKWLHKQTDLLKLLPENIGDQLTVTYHDPCHARQTQGVHKEPRALLSMGYKLREMENPAQCCGFGGLTIQSDRFELAQAAGREKSEMIIATNADIVSAECSACRLQLGNALFERHSDMDFAHPLELVAQHLKNAADANAAASVANG